MNSLHISAVPVCEPVRRAIFSRHTITSVLALWLLVTVATASADMGGYIGVGIGEADYGGEEQIEQLCVDEGFICNADTSDTGYKFFGGVNFGKFFALEGGFVALGDLTADTEILGSADVSLDLSGLTLALVPQIPVGDFGSVFGKAGLLYWNADLEASAPAFGLRESVSESGAGVSIGLGGAVNFTENASFRLEWERLSFDGDFDLSRDSLSTDDDIDFFSASFLYSFP